MKKLALVLCLVFSNAFAMEAPVVGGTQVPLGKWPDAVLVVAPTALCSGTLIAPTVVLTAGHCIETHPVEVWTGTVDFGASTGERIPVARALAYPSWEHSFDVGVLVLARAASPPPRAVASTCTADAALVRGAEVQLVGFGLTTESGTGENTALNEAPLAVTDPDCTTAASCQPAIAPRGEFVAGGNGRDACFGDSGGPVYLVTPAGAALLGVVSRGLSDRADVPCGGGGVFERADKVASWVRRQTGAHLERTHCTGKADDGEDDAPDDAGGCSSGGASNGALVVLALGLGLVSVARRRREQR
jgi:secreted trypsin-like serine protease